MLKRLVLGFMVFVLGLGLMPVLPVSAKQAKADVSSTCEVLSVNLTDYAATVPANPGQQAIAPTSTQVLISPAIAEVSHQEYNYSYKKIDKNSNETGKAIESDWVTTKPAEVSGYSNWSLIGERKVITMPGIPALYQTVTTPGQLYIAPTFEKTNKVKVTIDSATVADTTFSQTYANSWTFNGSYLAHDYTVDVVAWDGQGSTTETGTSDPCSDPQKIVICHSSQPNESNGNGQGPQDNPYQQIEVGVSAADGISGNSHGQGDHYSEHSGPLFVPGTTQNYWGDIIPPLSGVHPGLNWSELGQAIYNNDCDYPSKVATAAVSVVAATCQSGAKLEYGNIENALFSGTANGTIGGPASYTVVATASNDALFSGNHITKTFEGSLAAQLGEDECIVVPEKPTDIVEIKIETSVDCETKIATILTTTTTIGSVLVDNEWVATEPVDVPVTTTRDATEQEITECIPEKPADIVEAITTEDPAECKSGTVTITVTTTTTGSELIENEWIATEPVITTETSTRPATDNELSECPVTTPEDPTDEGEVLGGSTLIKELPRTSGTSTLASIIAFAGLAIVITILSVVGRSVLVKRT